MSQIIQDYTPSKITPRKRPANEFAATSITQYLQELQQIIDRCRD